MTNPAGLGARERNQFMITKIRSDEAAPYREGGYALRVLSVRGRRSGEPRLLPIAVAVSGGDRYLCAPNRQRDWVRNVLAAGECEIEGDPAAVYRAVLAEDRPAATAVHEYLSALGRTAPEWPFPAGASVAEIQAHVTEIAVFRLEPAVSAPEKAREDE